MNIAQQFCSIQGHEGQKLSHICIFIECKCSSRWLCSKCVQIRIHNHYDGFHGFSFYRTENQFKSYFNMKIQPFIDLKLESQDGNLIKCNYVKQIYQNLSSLNTQSSFKNQQEQNQDLIYQDLVRLKELTKNLIKNYENEKIKVQNIDQIYFQITKGLRFLNNNEINILLNLDNNFQTMEIQIYQEILYYAKKYECYKNKNDIQRLIIINLLKESSERLIRLKDFINFQQHHFIFERFISIDNIYLSQTDMFLAVLDNQNYQSKIKLNNLDTKKPIKQYLFRFKTHQQLAFDSLWKYLIIQKKPNLYYYLIGSDKKSFKLIKISKFETEYFIRGIFVKNMNKIMIIFNNLIQIRDFKNRCVNQINFQLNSNICLKIVNYGIKKNIIVIIIGDVGEIIYIYRDYESHPFIRQLSSEELPTKIEQITLTNDDLYLLTQDTYELKLWQIDYQAQQLILVNRVQIKKLENFQFSNNTSDYNIFRFTNGYIQIFDKNFNIIYEIKQQRLFNPNKILVSKQLIITLDYGSGNYGHKINILKKANQDYDKLQQ